MCDFHSIVVRRDGATAHVAGNSHSGAVAAAKWTENDSIHKENRFIEVEWDGLGDYRGAEAISKSAICTEKQRKTIDRHYGALALALKGDAGARKYFVDLGPEYRDVLLRIVEKNTNVPLIVSRLFARLLNGCRPDLVMGFIDRYTTATAGSLVDMALVWPKFAHWMLVDPADGVVKFAKRKQTREAIEAVGGLYARWIAGVKPPLEEWRLARNNAYDAAAAAYADTADAAAAAYADAAAAAADAAAAAYAYAYDAAAAAADTAATARQKFYDLATEKVLGLIFASPFVPAVVDHGKKEKHGR